jgi:hypothetical protein
LLRIFRECSEEDGRCQRLYIKVIAKRKGESAGSRGREGRRLANSIPIRALRLPYMAGMSFNVEDWNMARASKVVEELTVKFLKVSSTFYC